MLYNLTMSNKNKCIICGLPQKDHKTNMHIFGVQIGCPLGRVDPKKSTDMKVSKK